MKTHGPIKTLFLDIGGVFLTNGWGHSSRVLAAEKFQLDFEEMESRHHVIFDTFEIGKISLEDYLNGIIFYKKRSFSLEEFKQFMFSESKKLPHMLEFIHKIKQEHQLKVVAVNNEAKELNEYRIKKFHLDETFDFFVSSCYAQLKKPDHDFYRLAIDMAQTPPEQILYIDDRLVLVEAAKTLGIQGLHHIDYDTTSKELNSRLNHVYYS